METALDLYNSNKEWYDHLPERKYIILDFLPSCDGNILNVGVHSFNQNDEVCCKKGTEYETLDLDPQYAVFGSTQKHTTIDLLNYTPEYKFNNIILFGVLGIPNGLGGDGYTLHQNEDRLIKKIDELLDIDGRVLLGPDVHPDSGAGPNSYSTEDFWNSLIQTNDIFNNKYTIETNWRGWGNMIIVLKKVLKKI